MIILTGASGGIGKELLAPILKLDHVVALYNTSKPEISLDNNRLNYHRVNLEEPNGIKSFVKKLESKISKVTIVHAAALSIDALAANYEEADWDRIMRVNLKANFLLNKAFLPHMIRENWGRIIHISSLVGIEGTRGTIAYSTSKTGLMGMSRVLAKEYAQFNITSNVLVLGYFEVGLINTLPDEEKKRIIKQIPSGKLGSVSNIANAINFLMKSEYANGSAIHIDGAI